jgi:hypothetical protein
MRISILNCPDKEFKPFVRDSLMFYAEQLIPSKRLRDNINLTIKFNEKIDVWAFASIEDYNASNKPRDFLIEIHPWIGARNIFKTLAHEMVHIKQFVNLETNDTLSKWRGVPIDSDAIDYYQHPWELEAYGMEIGLFTNYAVKNTLWEFFADISNPDAPIVKEEIKWKNI